MHLLRSVSDDDYDLRGLQLPTAIDNVAQDRFSGKLVDYLGTRRLHARALAGGENNNR
jgi:hypothetical protein